MAHVWQSCFPVQGTVTQVLPSIISGGDVLTQHGLSIQCEKHIYDFRSKSRKTLEHVGKKQAGKTKICFTEQRGAVHSIGIWGRKENSQQNRLHSASSSGRRWRRRRGRLWRSGGGPGQPEACPARRGSGAGSRPSSPPPGPTWGLNPDVWSPRQHGCGELPPRLPLLLTQHPLPTGEAPQELAFRCPWGRGHTLQVQTAFSPQQPVKCTQRPGCGKGGLGGDRRAPPSAARAGAPAEVLRAGAQARAGTPWRHVPLLSVQDPSPSFKIPGH